MRPPHGGKQPPNDVNLCADHVRPPHGGKQPPNDVNLCADHVRPPHSGKFPPGEVHNCINELPKPKFEPKPLDEGKSSKLDSMIKKLTEDLKMGKIAGQPKIIERSVPADLIDPKPRGMTSKGPRARFEGKNIQVKPE